jgi:hypothetical protein
MRPQTWLQKRRVCIVAAAWYKEAWPVRHSPHAFSCCCTPGSVPGIDLIIGGHSHTFLYSPVSEPPDLTADVSSSADTVIGSYPTWINGVPILQAYWASRWGPLFLFPKHQLFSKTRSINGVIFAENSEIICKMLLAPQQPPSTGHLAATSFKLQR